VKNGMPASYARALKKTRSVALLLVLDRGFFRNRWARAESVLVAIEV